MLKIITVAVIMVLSFAFVSPGNYHSQPGHIIITDTTIPVAPQRVYLISPHEATAIMAASLRDVRELKIEDSKEGYRILRFRITIESQNGQAVEYMNAGSYFRPEIIWYFRNLAAKTFITIEDIELLSKTGQTNKAYPKIINAN